MSLDQDAQDPVAPPRRTRPAVRLLWFGLPVLAVLAGLVWLLQPLRTASTLPAPPLPAYTPEPPDYQEMLVLGPTAYAPRTQGAVRVLIRDPRSGEPLPGAEVQVALASVGETDPGEILFEGQTNDLGTLDASFAIPALAEGKWTMNVDALGPVGQQHVTRTITIQRPLVLSVGTHKRTYRPGEEVQVWVWAGGNLDRRPASGRSVSWVLLDPRGNPVCESAIQTSEYGVAQGNCALADGAGEGLYRLVATLGDATGGSELQVESGPPDLLHVDVQPARGYLSAAGPVSASIAVTDADGNPVANAGVEVEGRVAEGGTLLFRRAGRTDDAGGYAVSVPEQELLARGLASAGAVQLTAWAIDTQGRSGRSEHLTPVTQQAIVIDAWPEGGVLKPGMENRIQVRTRYPDGRAASCHLEATIPGLEKAVQVETNAGGLGWIPILPNAESRLRIDLRAADSAGSTGSARFEMSVAEGEAQLLLRLGTAPYTCAETMSVEAWTTEAATAVYLDLRLDGQLVATHSAAVHGERAQFEVPLPREWAGPVQLDAYVLAGGALLRDVREVWVTCPSHLQVKVGKAGADSTAHGEARIAFDARGEDGATAAVWLTALLGDPGELDVVREDAAPTRLVPAAELSPEYADTASKLRPISAEVLRAFESYREAWAKRAGAFDSAAVRISWGAVGLGVLSWAIALFSVWRRKRSLLSSLLSAVLVGALLIVAGVLGAYAGSYSMGPGAVLAFGLAWLGVLLVASAQAASGEGSQWLAVLAVTATAGGALAVGLCYATRHAMAAAGSLSLRGWAGLGSICLALSAYGTGQVQERKPRYALTVFALALLLAGTWAGALLSGWIPDGPVYQELPPLRPPVEPPVPVPIEAEATVRTSGQGVSLPLPTWGGSELLGWVPSIETDELGSALLDVPLAKTAGKVRVRALALDGQGRWGSADVLLDLAEPLWAAVQLPNVLTVGDQLDLPVRVRNTLPVSSSARISVTGASWFTLRPASAGAQEASIAAGGEHTFMLPLRIEAWGEQELRLALQSEAWSETITRTVSVQPNGKWVAGAYSWWVEEETGYKFRIPWAAYEDTDRIAVRIYAGPEGVLSDALARSSQHSGTSFDDLLASVEATLARLAQLQGTGDDSAALEQELSLDSQRLLAFETESGGFGLVPGAPPDLYRSAAAVRCLGELGAVGAVAPGVVERTVAWLLAQEGADGAWQLEEPPLSWDTLSHAELPVTGYVAWVLLDAGYGEDGGVQAAVQHLLEHLSSAQDPYVLAIVTNALLSAVPQREETTAALDRLAEQADVHYGIARWYSGLQTLSGGAGGEIEAGGYRTPSVKVEVTALATLALARGGQHMEEIEAGMAMLVDSRDVWGTWSAPWPTVAAIRALGTGLSEHRANLPARSPSARVSVAMNGGPARTLDVVGAASVETVFEELEKGYNDVDITVAGDRMAYQIVGSYCLRWSQVPPPLPSEEELSLEISYDRTSMSVGETITATVTAMLNRSDRAPLTLLDLGLPPGLVPLEADLEGLVNDGVIARYEHAGERLRVYLVGLSSEEPVRLAYRLQSIYPERVLTQPSYGIDLANPQRPAVRAPVEIVVNRP